MIPLVIFSVVLRESLSLKRVSQQSIIMGMPSLRYFHKLVYMCRVTYTTYLVIKELSQKLPRTIRIFVALILEQIQNFIKVRLPQCHT